MSMKRIYASTIGIEQGCEVMFSDFEAGGDMWNGKGSRERRVAVAFSEPFKDIPSVTVNLEMFDMDNSTNQRAETVVENATMDGFEIVFRTWGDTKVARANVAWMAIGGVDAEDNWDDMY